MDNNTYYIQALEELRRRYAKKEVSLLVGAGFSRNAYSRFPLWGDLLKDMVSELYHNEIYSSFINHHHLNRHSLQNYSDFEADKIGEIIRREGYLDIVSQYISKKGFREVIECYIEDRIPGIDLHTGILSTRKPQMSKQLDKSDLIAHKKLLEGNWDSIYTTNYDQLLEYTAKVFHKSWQTIADARSLSFCKQTQSIIKLHGDLRRKPDDDFAFDGNFNHRYIISKEDYDTYPTHHEAFTQLMRISLLQGTFCLMGFSGDDPNFISWIKWVRDILLKRRKGANSNNPLSDIKIFLVDVSDKEPSGEKMLFYRNHNICYIPLRNEVVSKRIKASCQSYPADLKKLIVAFLQYIYGGEKITTRYNECWRKISDSNPINKTPQIDAIDHDAYEEIAQLREGIKWISDPFYQKSILFRALNTKDPSSELIDLCQWAISDMKCLPEDLGDLYPRFIDFARTEEQRTLYTRITGREDTLRRPTVDITTEPSAEEFMATAPDWKRYENALRKGFVFDFSGLKQYLAEWRPDDKYRISKANLYSIFDKKAACDMLISAIDDSDNASDKYTATQLYNTICTFEERLSTSTYENQNLKSCREIVNELTKGLNRNNNNDINGYGTQAEQYIISSQPNDYETSIRFFQTVIDFPMSLRHTYLEPHLWLKVFRKLYERIPYPLIFLTMLWYDDKMATRIGQELAFSNYLYRSELPEILNRLISGYNDSATPPFIKPRILKVSKELLISVNVDTWEPAFMNIWKQHFSNGFTNIDEFIDRHLIEFIYEGLGFIKVKSNRIAIINDCLRHSQTGLNLTIDVLYYLKVQETDHDDITLKLIDDIIDNLSSVQEFIILGNLHHLIKDSETIRNLIDKANSLLNENCDDNGLYAIAHYMHLFQSPQDKLKQIILSHKMLWDNGLIDKGASLPEFINIHRFVHSVTWSENELLALYDKMVVSYEKLVNSYYFKDDKHALINFRYDRLLFEMKRFMIDHKDTLLPDPKRLEFYKRLNSSLYEKSGFTSVTDAICKNNAGIVIRGLNELYQQIIMDGIKVHLNELLVLMDRILFQKEAALGECLEYLKIYTQKWLEDAGSLPKAYKEKLKNILMAFSIDIFKELESDVPKCTLHICELADMVKDIYGFKMLSKPWIELLLSQRFNHRTDE